ncbi:MAG: hypothetical protein WC942_04525 [Clostridia bacterium]|jgi:hypothetical protein
MSKNPLSKNNPRTQAPSAPTDGSSVGCWKAHSIQREQKGLKGGKYTPSNLVVKNGVSITAYVSEHGRDVGVEIFGDFINETDKTIKINASVLGKHGLSTFVPTTIQKSRIIKLERFN